MSLRSRDCDNEMIPRVVHRSPGIYPMAEENQVEDRLMKAVRGVIASNGFPYF